MAGDTSIDMMINVLPGTLTGIFALNAGLSSINQQFQNMTKAVDNHFGIVDAAIVSATALATQFGLRAADAFGQYEQGMKIVQAVSNQSSAAIAELGQKANEFSVQYRMDIDELTDGLQTLGRAGLKDATEQAEVLENGLQTAKLEGRGLNDVLTELIQNTALLGGNLKSNDFGEQTEYVNDLLVATSMTAPINTHDISETLKYSGGIAAAAGANIETDEGKDILEDYMAAIAAFAQKGVKGSIAGTALRAFFNKPATQDSSVVEGLSMIGLKPEYLWEDDEETMKPISEQISLIQSQMDKKGISQMDRLQIWSKIVGGKMGQQMMKLDGSDIREITKDIQEANSAENLATKSMQTYQAAMKQTSEAGQVAFRAFGEHVARFLTPIAKILTPILEAMAHPVISTSAFIGFIALIGNAWKSLGKIFAAVRGEIGLVRSLMSSTILNQETRKSIVANRPWGTGGFAQEKADVAMITSQVKETNAVSNTGMSEILAKIEYFRTIVTATNNKIKEILIDIKSQLSSGIQIYSQEMNQAITSNSTMMKAEFDNAITQAAVSFETKMNNTITSSATKIKTEFQMALNSLTYTPKITPSGANNIATMAGVRRDTQTPSYFFTGNLEKQAKEIESKYQAQMSALENKKTPMVLSSNAISQEKTASIKLAQLEGEAQELAFSLKTNSDKIKELEVSLSEANVKEKENIEMQIANLKEKQALLFEEYELKDEEILIQEQLVTSLRGLIQQINAERLSLATGKGSTIVGVPGVMPAGYTGQIPVGYGPIMTQADYTARTGYGFGSYGYYGSQKSMPGMAGMFHWGMVPSEYHPDYSMTGSTHTPWAFGMGSGKGAELLAHLRSQEIAMTREMQQTLGISNQELIKFYEELLQVNMALAESRITTINQGKETTRVFSPTAMEKAYYEDTLYKTNRNMIPIYPSAGTGHITARQMRGLRALFGELNGPSAAEFEKEYSQTAAAQRAINSQYNRYNLPDTTKQLEQYEQQQKLSRVQGASYPASAMMLYNTMEENQKQQQKFIDESNKNLERNRGYFYDTRQKWKGFMKKPLASTAPILQKAGQTAGKALGGFSSAVGKATNFMGGPFFAGMMAVTVLMQVWNSLQEAYTKKLEEATNKLDEMIQKQSDAEDIFFNGKHEEGEREYTGWSEENPDATAEEKEDALLGAYGDIYDNREKGLSALGENTQQLAIATESVKRATEVVGKTYLDDSDFFSGSGDWSDFWHNLYKGETNVYDTSTINGGFNVGWGLGDISQSEKGNYAVDKFGEGHYSMSDGSYFKNHEVVLDKSWQTGEDYPWLQEFAPIIGADIWREGSTEGGLKIALGGAGYAKLSDIYSSIGGWDNSAWVRQGYNMNKSFGTAEDQNKLQMGLKNFQKDFSKLAKQTRRFEKATGTTALKSLNTQFGKTGNMKKALKNLETQDPKLVSYLKSLAIKTGMDEQQVLMAAQLQQLQEMHAIGQEQVAPRMENLVATAYDQVAYGRQTYGTVAGAGQGAISAAQNAYAIAALLNAQMEDSLNKKSFTEYQSHYEHPDELKYQTPEQLAAAAQYAHDHPTNDNKWLRDIYDTKMGSYAAVNAMYYNPNLSAEDAAQKGRDFVDYYTKQGSSGSAILDTLRKGATEGLQRQVLSAYDASLDDEESSGSGGSGSGKGSNKDKDTGTKKERVDLVLCNKKEIPKLNVNLFKKAPSFTILNKNFKLRDIKVNTQDKPKAVLASIKNAIIDVQKRTDPKIIQDEEAIYDPVGATDGNTPSGTSDVRTDSN